MRVRKARSMANHIIFSGHPFFAIAANPCNTCSAGSVSLCCLVSDPLSQTPPYASDSVTLGPSVIADARLWLLGTSGQTKVIMIVNFTEDNGVHVLRYLLLPAPTTALTRTPNTRTASADADNPAEPTEEARFCQPSTPRPATAPSPPHSSSCPSGANSRYRFLAPFPPTPMFRRTPADTINEEFATPVLPAPGPTTTRASRTHSLLPTWMVTILSRLPKTRTIGL